MTLSRIGMAVGTHLRKRRAGQRLARTSRHVLFAGPAKDIVSARTAACYTSGRLRLAARRVRLTLLSSGGAAV